MPKETMNTIAYADDSGLEADSLNTAAYGAAKGFQGNVQDEFEKRTDDQLADGVISGMTPAIDAPNDEVDIASGLMYFRGARIVNAGSVAFAAQPTGTYHIYVDATGNFGAQTAALDSSTQFALCDVDWDLPSTTLSNLVDLRVTGLVGTSQIQDDAVTDAKIDWSNRRISPESQRLDDTNPPTEVTTYRGAALGFETGADDIMYATFYVPSWVDTTKDLKIHLFYTMSTTVASKNVSLNLEYKCVGDGEDATPAAWDAAVEDEIAVTGTAEQLTKLVGTNLKIATGDFAAGDLILCKIWRDVDGVADNHTGTFELHSFWLQEA